jgi:hypothetical protein
MNALNNNGSFQRVRAANDPHHNYIYNLEKSAMTNDSS